MNFGENINSLILKKPIMYLGMGVSCKALLQVEKDISLNINFLYHSVSNSILFTAYIFY